MPAQPRRPPYWHTWTQAARHLCTGATVHVAAPVALVVGTILTAINQGTVIANGDLTWALWARVAANYTVPFVVSSTGYLAAGRQRDAGD